MKPAVILRTGALLASAAFPTWAITSIGNDMTLPAPLQRRDVAGVIFGIYTAVGLGQVGDLFGLGGGNAMPQLSEESITQIKNAIGAAVNQAFLNEHVADTTSLMQNIEAYHRNDAEYGQTCGIEKAKSDLEHTDGFVRTANRLAARLNTTSFGVPSAPSYQLVFGMKLALISEQIAVLQSMPTGYQDEIVLRASRQKLKAEAGHAHYTLATVYPARLYNHIYNAMKVETSTKWSSNVRPSCKNAKKVKTFKLMRRPDYSGDGNVGFSQTVKTMTCNLCGSSCPSTENQMNSFWANHVRGVVQNRKLRYFGDDYPNILASLKGISETPVDDLVFE